MCDPWPQRIKIRSTCRMASPSSAAVLFTARASVRFPPHIVLLVVAALLIYGAAAAVQPTMMTCSGHGQSSSAVTSGELARFLDAVCAGAYGAAAHRSHNMSTPVAGTNRTMHGVAECRPDVPVPDCAACLAAASARLVAGRTSSSSAAVWHDACFLRYSDGDPADLFRDGDDECTATVFNATSALPPHMGGGGGRAVVRRLLAAAANRTVRSHTCRGGGGGATASASTAAGARIYGLTRCATGVSCADCRRCLRGALAAAEREYNGSVGMQILQLGCMARYESYPFYNTARQVRHETYAYAEINGGTGFRPLNGSRAASNPAPAPPAPTPPGGQTPSPSPPAAENPRPPPPAPTPPGGQTPSPSPPAAEKPRPPPPPAPALPAGVHHADPAPPAATPPDQTRVMQRSHGKMTPKILKIILIVSITTGLVVASVILVLIIWFRRKQPQQQRGQVIDDGMKGENMHDQGEEQWSTEEEGEDGESMSCQLYSYQVLEDATGHFSNTNKLGSGGFGTVFRGTLENGRQVAVKRLKDSKRNIHELDREISIVSDLRHKNLVRFLGYCFQDEGKFLVYEYVPNNSLEKFWYKACFQSQKLEWATWFNIIKGIARGLQFLHGKGVIHRDLKPHNVLLDENFNPKIADFDLMRIYDKQKTHESTEKVAGTFGYMAPECTSGQKFLLSIKSDVYSYGVLVLEIITGHKIYTFEGQNSESLVEYVWQHWKEKRAGDIVDGDLLGVGGQDEEHAARQALRCVHVALLCVQSDRSRRPTMAQVIAMLRSDDETELQEPSLPGYVVFRPTAASGPVRLPCLGCR